MLVLILVMMNVDCQETLQLLQCYAIISTTASGTRFYSTGKTEFEVAELRFS